MAKLNQRRFRRNRLIHRHREQGLNLTSMMDMFTIILVFLLKSYSVAYIALKPPAGIELPKSSSSELPKRYLAVDVKADGIFVEKKLVQKLSNFYVLKSAQSNDILPVMRNLVQSQIDHGEIESTIAVIRADKDTPFRIIWRIMLTLRGLGFQEFQNLVQQES